MLLDEVSVDPRQHLGHEADLLKRKEQAALEAQRADRQRDLLSMERGRLCKIGPFEGEANKSNQAKRKRFWACGAVVTTSSFFSFTCSAELQKQGSDAYYECSLIDVAAAGKAN